MASASFDMAENKSPDRRGKTSFNAPTAPPHADVRAYKGHEYQRADRF
jgi:hypothetical protein